MGLGDIPVRKVSTLQVWGLQPILENSQIWWHMLIIPVLGKEKQTDARDSVSSQPSSSLKVNSSWRTAQRLTSSLYKLIHTDVIINKQVSLPFEYTKHLSMNLHTSGQFGDHSQCACHTDEMIHTSTTHRKMACVKNCGNFWSMGVPERPGALWWVLAHSGTFWSILEHLF